MDELFGLGPLEEFLREATISDILVNGAHRIYVERDGRLHRTDATFRDQSHLMQVIQRVAARVGRRIDESSPMLDARLADGSRVNAIIPPLALDGPTMSLRRFGTIPFAVERLVELNSLTAEIVTFAPEPTS
jgi:pilus assembly protein CpaF